jgi:hypothetical protein
MCLRNYWESFSHFVLLHPIQNNMQVHINTRERNKSWTGRNGVYVGNVEMWK